MYVRDLQPTPGRAVARPPTSPIRMFIPYCGKVNVTSAEGLRHLLVIDDDNFLRTTASLVLSRAGYRTTLVQHGPEAVELLQTQDFDLILLDVMMPDVDGYEVCRRMRATTRGATVPILMLTGLDDTASIDKAFECGATDFVTKPVNWTLLGHRIRFNLRANDVSEAVMRTSAQLVAAQRLAEIGSWEWTPATDTLTCSRELLRILGRDETLASALDMRELLAHVSPVDRQRVRELRETTARSGLPYELRFSIKAADGRRRVVQEKADPQRNGMGDVVTVAAVIQDITDRVVAEDRINELAFRDVLTGLPNRQCFLDEVAARLQQAEPQNRLDATLYLDLDRFRTINDVLGRRGGDAVLRLIAERLRGLLPASASMTWQNGQAGASEVLARVDANAFAIERSGFSGNQEIGQFCESVLRTVAEPMKVGEYDLAVTASIGVALHEPQTDVAPGRPATTDLAESLLQRAERAMFTAKSGGGAQVRFFDQAMSRAASLRVSLEHELRRAIGGGELRLHFQPKIDALRGTMVGAEALVRWHHPERGLVPPGDFIPLAEETGLIVPLSDWVLGTSVQNLRRWREAGLATVPIAVNLASPLVMQRDFVDRLEEITRGAGIEPGSIMLEITETLLMTDLERTTARLAEIKQRGFSLSLDDFGTGFSSLGYLNAFPIDELKIDRSFIREMTKGGPNSAIANVIIDLGRRFGLEVVAEGVETAEQSALLVELGCPLQQGFLFARPMPADLFETALEAAQRFSQAAG
jgi:diguanylate cyclase (GGDEF)-like protein/PAS domain S-box-containing protein